ncbi:MAG TPA: hypothetical protein EYQ75_14265 [Planctomycetaceae bacterium]|nr:hypothetical protein [Planctomycetaceae bacterium]
MLASSVTTGAYLPAARRSSSTSYFPRGSAFGPAWWRATWFGFAHVLDELSLPSKNRVCLGNRGNEHLQRLEKNDMKGLPINGRI